MPQKQQLDWKRILADAGPYPVEAFNFVREGLGFTVRQVHEAPESLPEPERHVSGQQLCMGLRDYAIEQYGLLARTVLEGWNITRTDDFGRIVFAMVSHGLMSTTNGDTMDDFRGVYDFEEAFNAGELRERIGVS
jgi:uncharacterized repeat protein (TIGR04138 family)